MHKSILITLVVLISLFAVNVAFANKQDPSGNTFSVQVGKIKLCLLSEGTSTVENKITVNASKDDLAEYLPNGKFNSAINAFLLITPNKKILIDTGFGRELFKNLEHFGVKPEEIDIVLLTHMHGDHISGLLRDGKIAFPNADIYVAQKEINYWQGKDAADKLKPYGDKVKTFEPLELEQGGLKLMPGISAIAAYGHTPGHTMFMVESGKQKALLWGDIVHVTPVQIPVPDVFVVYDVDSDEAVKTRKKILAYLAGKDIIVAAAHIESPGMGKIIKDELTGKYEFIFQK